MDLEKLKKAMDDAAAALAKSPDDAGLKSAHEAAKLAYDEAKAKHPGDDGDDEDDDSQDESGLDPKAKKIIEKLRKQSGKYRTERNTNADKFQKLQEAVNKIVGGEDDEPVEEKLKAATMQNEAQAFEMATLEAAMEHGVGKADLKYFKFLLAEKLGEMEEGAELDPEEVAEIAKQAKRSQGGGGNGGRSSVDDEKGGKGKNPNGGGSVTLDEFVAMNITDKSKLYVSNRALYEKLFAEAKSKRRI